MENKKPFGGLSEGLFVRIWRAAECAVVVIFSAYESICRFGFTRTTATTTIRIGEHNDFNHAAKVGVLISFMQVKIPLSPKKIFYFA
ncbi:MAG: hypothetical protein J0L99_16075 [Chitinophagales bacterium]|nr:hypothetical protein [Chitinophagales bacterium]